MVTLNFVSEEVFLDLQKDIVDLHGDLTNCFDGESEGGMKGHLESKKNRLHSGIISFVCGACTSCESLEYSWPNCQIIHLQRTPNKIFNS
jgi:hypothetical protein